MKISRIFRKIMRLTRRVVLRKNRRKGNKVSEYFIFDKSCQIPNLSFIYETLFGIEDSGTLVEVGAFDGLSFSNSVGLLNRGWTGLLVEPIPTFARKCRDRNIANPKVRVIEKAVSNELGLINIQVAGPMSSSSSELISEYERQEWSQNAVTSEVIQVETITLDELLKTEEIPQEFDLLIVDVEGYETKVFEEFSIEKWMPKVIIVELSDFHPSLNTHKFEHFHLSNRIIYSGYSVVYKDAINTIFVKDNLLKTLFDKS
jgi:FkbM family methyltransferase